MNNSAFSCVSENNKMLMTRFTNTLKLNITLLKNSLNTNLKLKLTDSFSFKATQQPLESGVALVVNPSKSFQTINGFEFDLNGGGT